MNSRCVSESGTEHCVHHNVYLMPHAPARQAMTELSSLIARQRSTGRRGVGTGAWLMALTR
ncbi:hypothetical protein BC834DRAFT_893601 [Gloeopeniophorella convolvens]|nr:hypothetical protein BC834DRAFT_893601 [Gloeopeniophorella convolvens]